MSLADIKELRELTGAGLSTVKKALEEANGDKEEAMKIIRLAGQQKVSKREGRSANAGLIVAKVIEDGTTKTGIMIEINSETDFVAKNQKFIDFADQVMDAALASQAGTLAELLAAAAGEESVKDLVESMGALVGEKVEVSKLTRISGDDVSLYLHRSNPDLPPQIGVMVATDAAASGVAHDIALHIAFANPEYLDRDSVPAEVLDKEKTQLEEITRAEGKPEKMLDKIVAGRLTGFYKEVVLLDQPFSKDPKTTIGKMVEATGGKVLGFARFHVGA
ncbi:MAG: translation elongation factor Ts [Varibaculum sp.]|nr:translation elongation factor Ts [Varibaculum sp.]